MSDDVLQLTYRLAPEYADVEAATEYHEQTARRQFGEALYDWLLENRGGIVSPIHIREDPRYAEYERVGKTQAYRFRRVSA
jgi:hypothetical protein